MSGHSKWNNIKHKKEKADAAKAKIFTKIGKEMAVAIKAGGPDPNNNSKLRDLIAKAKANNVPNDNIQRTIKKFTDNADINFVMEDALSFDGNTGPYAQYTYARTCSILDKAGEDGKAVTDAPLGQLEVELAKTVAMFPERVNAAITDYEPSVVTRYILDLCAAFNRFYHECSIVNCEDDKLRESRIALTRATNQVLRTSLHLICLQTPDKI